MGWISSIFVQKAIDAAVQLDCIADTQRGAFFRLAGVEEPPDFDPGLMISDSRFFEVLEHIAQISPVGRAIPIVMGASMRCDDYGAFGLAFKSAPDLLGAYDRVARFGKVVTSVANFRVVERGATTLMEVIPADETRLGLQMTNELALAAALALSREVSTGPVTPVAVHFSSVPPVDDSQFKQHFAAPLHFGATHDAIELSTDITRQPNRLSDIGMSQFFERHLTEQLDDICAPSDLERDVLAHIGQALSAGVPTLNQTAERLGMSSRTLQRRLSDDALSYQSLVTRARKTLSAQVLRQTDYALAEVAFLSGFSDQSTFSRAFKRWYGQTPAQYRRHGARSSHHSVSI